MEPTRSKSKTSTKGVRGIQQAPANACKPIASDPTERGNESVHALWHGISNGNALGERLHFGSFQRHRGCRKDSCRPCISELVENDPDPVGSGDYATVKICFE